ncbi:MAG: winged helix-turn-helix transcriptional regulator [Rhizobiales bacterium]|nr:winged helix-turn-helix transcriptional regulator [Hyphomicrobiales bacterium]
MHDQLSSTFQAMSDPARRAILTQLTHGTATVGELSEPLELTAPAVSHHLKVLERAGLVTRRVMGQHRMISLEPGQLQQAAGWLEDLKRFWEESFGRLDAELAAQADQSKEASDE